MAQGTRASVTGQAKTLLDEFAMAALTGTYAAGSPGTADAAAKKAYEAAVAMMKHRTKGLSP
jgi:hypothetical protein